MYRSHQWSVTRLRQWSALGLLIGLCSGIALAGNVIEHRVASPILAEQGEAGERELNVYVPDGYAESDAAYPVIYLLHGATGGSRTFLGAGYADKMRGVDIGEIADRLISAGEMQPAIIVLPDMSRAWGAPLAPYDRYLAEELVPFVDQSYRTLAERGSRAIAGHSEGGHGALHIALAYPELFSAVAAYAAGSPGGPLPDGAAITGHDQEAQPLSFWLYVGKNDEFRLIPSANQQLAKQVQASNLPLIFNNDGGDHFNRIAARVAESLRYFSTRFVAVP